MVEREEPELIRASQAGDLEAFEALVCRYQRMVHSLTYRMTGSLADADDLAQETFVQAWQQLREFRGEAKYSSWLYRIAVNLTLNWKRKDRRRTEALQEFGSAEDTRPATADLRLAQGVQEALERLHPKQRAAIVLTTYDGLNHAEAARVLGCSETTVSWRVFAARAKLRRWLRALARRPSAEEQRQDSQPTPPSS